MKVINWERKVNFKHTNKDNALSNNLSEILNENYKSTHAHEKNLTNTKFITLSYILENYKPKILSNQC